MKNPNRFLLAILCVFFSLCAGMTAVAQRVQDPLKKKEEQVIIPDRSKQRSRNVKDGIRVDDLVPSNAVRINVRYRKAKFIGDNLGKGGFLALAMWRCTD